MLPPASALIVDDQDANLLALEALLSDLCVVAKARSGHEALRYLLDQDFALLIVDVQMPGIDGFDLLRLIRGRERSKHTPVIFVTAYDSSDFPVEKAYALGAVDYLVKPLSSAIVRAKVAVFVDLFQKTEQVRRMQQQRITEEAARRGAELFRRAIVDAPIPIIMHTEDGEILEVSHAWKEMTGYTKEDFRSFDDWLDRAFGSEKAAVLANIQESLEEGRVVRGEHTLTTKDGEQRVWMFRRSSPFVLPDGRRLLVGMAMDVSERRRAEEALQEADRRKDEFLATLAHELRNPLAPLVTGLDILCRPGVNPEDMNQIKSMMKRQLSHLVRLVDDLIDISRITRGKVVLKKGPVDLADAVLNAVEATRPLADSRRQSLSVALPERSVVLDADATRLVQVIANLISNSIRYTPEGGNIRVSADVEATWAVVWVRDDGQGIQADFLPYVFEMFRQSKRSLDRSEGGLGIGLTLVKNLVELHGGTVEAFSEGAGKGAAFVVRIPIG